jgi:hypothetical protein
MLRCILAALAALVLVTVTLIPDEADARGGRGGGGYRGGGGVHRGGAVHAGRIHGGVGRYGGRYAGRVGYGGYRGGYYRRGLAYGAVGAAAAYGAYGYYGNRGGCYYNQYGQTVCPQQYPYRY